MEGPSLGIKFEGHPQQIGFLLARILKYGHEIPTEGAKVRVVKLVLKGTTARWMVTFHNANASELRNFNRYMTGG